MADGGSSKRDGAVLGRGKRKMTVFQGVNVLTLKP